MTDAQKPSPGVAGQNIDVMAFAQSSAPGLDPNCQGFKVDAAGKVIGVQLGITPWTQNRRYEIYSARLRDEYEANGQTVANCFVLDKNGIPTGIQVIMAWPGDRPPFEGNAYPGNANNAHVIANGYAPPKMGPLCLYVGTPDNPVSDILYGLGLPNNRHVSYDVYFREIGDTPPDPDPGDLVARIEVLEDTVVNHEVRIGSAEQRVDALIANANAWSAYFPDGPQYVA